MTPIPATDEVLDASAVMEARSTMLDKFPRLVGFFLEDAAIYITKIEEGFRANDAQGIVPPAHTLKSSARQMGAMKLADAAMTLETEARKALSDHGSLAQVAPVVATLQDLLARTRRAFETLTA